MRLIDADNLTENLAYDIANHPIHGNYKITVASVRAAIYSAPVVDAVPVVRCKDCIHSISYVDTSGAIAYVVCNLDEDSDEIELRTPMDYCSYGEREEANT